MRRFIALTLLCLLALIALVDAQSESKYKVGTVVNVSERPLTADSNPDLRSFEVSVRVDDMIYVVLAVVPVGTETVKYIAGRQVLVRVGEKVLTYNNILGQSLEVPIVRQEVVEAKK